MSSLFRQPGSSRAARLHGRKPPGGLLGDKEWLLATEAFALSSDHVALLERLGPLLLEFMRACNLLYRQSVRGKQPEWIASWLDRGKPTEMIALARESAWAQELPRVLRPDLILTESGFGLTEIDSLPGGIGLTHWLNQAYAEEGEPVLGGAQGMREGFDRVFPRGSVLLSGEGADYEPEFAYLVGHERVRRAETFQWDGEPVYRFVEAFEWLDFPKLRTVPEGQAMTPPLKPYLEEKLWLALFWLRPLLPFWRRELGDKGVELLRKVIPYSWVLDPTLLPPHAVIPELGIARWQELAGFSQKERELVLKISGFSAEAWGARGVWVGSDLSAEAWSDCVQRALQRFETHPFVLQRFVRGALVRQPYASQNAQGDWEEREMQGRARVCPYYFVDDAGAVTLGGVLVTLCPADKKLLHGMRDAVLSPAKLRPSDNS